MSDPTSEDWTPDTRRVREFYKHATAWNFNHDQPLHISATREKQAAEFDRWLEDTMRTAKAEALREAGRSMRLHKDAGHWNLRDEVDPVNAAQSPDAWLEARADRIEGGGEHA